jgi:adenylate cyclase
VPTVALHDVLRREAAARSRPILDLSGRAVFVGQSELISHLGDDFATVFSRPDGVDLSGVEIAATAFANLLDGRAVKPASVGSRLALVAAFGLGVGLLAGLLPALVAVMVCLALAITYFAGAQIAFTRADLWLPVAVPLLVQLPLGLLTGLLVQYRDAHQYREGKIAAALNKRRHAICMVSDAEGYTSLSESMRPEDLQSLMGGYMQAVIGSIKRQGGAVLTTTGDGAIGLWTSTRPERRCRARACAAALEIERAVAAFNRLHGPPGLPTRIGLHAGWLRVGKLGAVGRYDDSVFGDPMNTAARIEQLNKQLGTYVLASDTVTAELSEFLLRPLGRFQMVGKKEVVRLSELRGLAAEPCDSGLLARFAQALTSFEDERWDDAARRFEGVLADHPSDGPARFYLDRCRLYLSGAPLPPEPTVVRLDHK